MFHFISCVFHISYIHSSFIIDSPKWFSSWIIFSFLVCLYCKCSVLNGWPVVDITALRGVRSQSEEWIMLSGAQSTRVQLLMASSIFWILFFHLLLIVQFSSPTSRTRSEWKTKLWSYSWWWQSLLGLLHSFRCGVWHF